MLQCFTTLLSYHALGEHHHVSHFHCRLLTYSLLTVYVHPPIHHIEDPFDINEEQWHLSLVFSVIKTTFTTQNSFWLHSALPIKCNCNCWQVINCNNKHIPARLLIICLEDKLLHKQHFHTCFTSGNYEQLNCTFISQGSGNLQNRRTVNEISAKTSAGHFTRLQMTSRFHRKGIHRLGHAFCERQPVYTLREQRSWYQATDRFIMLANKCQTLYNQPGACALVGFNMGEILSKKVKALTQCVHNPHLQANIIGGGKTWFTHADRRRRKSTVLFDKLCKLGIDMYCSRSCQKQRWFKVPDKLKAAHSAARSVWCTRKTEWERNEISGTTTLSTANSRVLIVKCTIIKSEQQAMCCCVFINKLWHEWS